MKTSILRSLSILTLVALISPICSAETYVTKKRPVNEAFLEKYGRSFFDIKNVNAFPIPHVLNRLDNGKKTKNAVEWYREVRPQILNFFDNEVYGQIPPRPEEMEFDLVESSDDALDGTAKRRQYKIIVKGNGNKHSFILLLYMPKDAKNIPAFVCPNFASNATLIDEEEVLKIDVPALKGRIENKKRGYRASRIPIRDIVGRGFAIATFCYHEVYNDDRTEESRKNSVYKIFKDDVKFIKGGAIAAWAWGNMRVMDLLETIPEIDANHIGVVGHSRLGKTALLTGTHDTRFAYVCVNNSGCMGDALSKRRYGESLGSMTDVNFPYWFLPNLKKYSENEGALPVDQHHLLATVAPRMLYTTASAEDYWADPEGQLLGLIHACPAFELFGGTEFPNLGALKIEKPFHGDVAFHIRSGKHNITPYDWKNFMDYAEKRGWKPAKKR